MLLTINGKQFDVSGLTEAQLTGLLKLSPKQEATTTKEVINPDAKLYYVVYYRGGYKDCCSPYPCTYAEAVKKAESETKRTGNKHFIEKD